MAYTGVNKSSSFMSTVRWTGNGSTMTITGVGFNADWVWTKLRSGIDDHRLFDQVRGINKYFVSNKTDVQTTDAILSTNSDGYNLASAGEVTANNGTFVGWNWKAGGGQGSSNTDGSINTTYTSVSTTAGLSISTYTGTGSNATVGHGLGVAPKMIIFRRLDSADDTTVYHTSLGATKKIDLNNTGASSTVSSVFNNTAPTNSVMSVGTNGRTNASSGSYVAYAFAEKPGYSKFGEYKGNGDANGVFVYTGFAVKWLMVKEYGSTGNWLMWDNTTPNWNRAYKMANGADAENSADNVSIDLLSNGFKFRGNAGDSNGDGNSILYMAFGQSLVGSNNVPATAR